LNFFVNKILFRKIIRFVRILVTRPVYELFRIKLRSLIKKIFAFDKCIYMCVQYPYNRAIQSVLSLSLSFLVLN